MLDGGANLRGSRPARWLGATSSAALHAALAFVAIQSLSSRELPTRETHDTEVTPFMVSFIELPDLNVSAHGVNRSPIELRPDQLELPPIPLPRLRPIASDSFDAAQELDCRVAVAEAERLQGIYVKQILARIQRLREARGDSIQILGTCVAKVVQDEFGRVQDVDLRDCPTAATESQVALIALIRAASPLPRPPDRLAMGSYLTIDFSYL